MPDGLDEVRVRLLVLRTSPAASGAKRSCRSGCPLHPAAGHRIIPPGFTGGDVSLMRARVLFLVLAATFGAQAHAALLVSIPLQWRPTSDLRLGAAQMSQASVHFDVFRDMRANKQAIGENREDQQPKPVTTSDDVGSFVSTHMRELFESAGLKTVDSGGTVTLKGEVTQFFVRETTLYRSEVAVHLTVVGRDGKVLWSGTASGEAKRFGRSYEAEDYYEVLSDAIVNTVSSMLQSAPFQKALSGS
jgi:hypothetical protein